MNNRAKSFYWRLGMMILASFISFLSASIVDLQLSTQTTIVVGLILGEISKAINVALQEKNNI